MGLKDSSPEEQAFAGAAFLARNIRFSYLHNSLTEFQFLIQSAFKKYS